MLDSKEEEDVEVVKQFPSLREMVSEESRKRFEDVLLALDALHVPYTYNPLLVRGLDYYTHTCFEVTSDLRDTRQNAVITWCLWCGCA